jgi:thymidine kinase
MSLANDSKVEQSNVYKKYGVITLYMGPMKAQKTSALLRDIKIARIRSAKNGMKICVIGNKKDNRFDEDAKAIITHSGVRENDCIKSLDLTSVNVNGISHVFIDEGQFFPDLTTSVLKMIRSGINVTISALDAYADQTLWPEIAKIIPYVTYLHKLSAVCDDCGGDALVTIDKQGFKAATVKIGADEIYSSKCIHCSDAFYEATKAK